MSLREAVAAGYAINVDYGYNILTVSVNGYGDKVPELYNTVLNVMKRESYTYSIEEISDAIEIVKKRFDSNR